MASKAYFQQSNASGVSLHSHLTEVIHKLLISKDPNALDNLENISLEIKKQHFTAAEMGVKNPPPPLPAGDDWSKRSNKLFSVDTSEEDAGIQNLLEEMSLFEWAGVGLGPEELYRVFLAMTSIKAQYALKSVRFFGKVLGTESDYYVVQGIPTSPPPTVPVSEGAVPAEPSGSGLNSLAYFVSTDVSMPFVPLPDVTPEQVVSASLIKKYLTGSLDAPVRCFPPFPGTEANLLRAQIARISAATVLVPADKFKADEESEATPPPLVENEEYTAKEAKEMAPEDWVKIGMGILKIGRCTNPPKPEPKEGEEEAEEEEGEVEEEVPSLAPLSADSAIGELGGLTEPVPLVEWNFKLLNAKGAAVAIAQSNVWPGAYAAATKAAMANIYVGYGVSASATSFTPQPPPEILGEAADLEEQAEVTLEAENELLKAIEESKMAAEAEAEAEEE